MTDLEKVCMISFDEMKVPRSWEIRKSDETVLSPYNYVQVAMIRGIMSPWKEIIFYDFNFKMTLELLINIIVFVESIVFFVCLFFREFYY